MTDRQPLVLLAEDDTPTRAALAGVLRRGEVLRVEQARHGGEALEKARALRPDLIISDYGMPVLDGFELCRKVKADPELAGTMFVILSGRADASVAVQGLDLGVDDYVRKPVEPEELLARTRAMLRLKRRYDQLRDDKLALQTLHAELGRSFEQLLQLLGHLIDLGRPGATERGRRLADLAVRLATRFEVPPELVGDLSIAARLLEIGAIVEGDALRAVDGTDPLARRYTVVTRAVLQEVDRLRDVAQLIEAVSEHWDGTGFPGHYQKGQIPLRSRLLRVAADYLAELDRGLTPGAALALVESRSGTWYDPAIVLHLRLVVDEGPAERPVPGRRFVPVGALEPGMVLAADLCTASGVKLLVRGSAITPGSLAIIRRRHANDPVIDGPWIGAEAVVGA